MYRNEEVGVFWNRKKETPENVVNRLHWTEVFVQWSPLGTYLATMHSRGAQLWGGANWTRQTRFPHPNCNLIDFSPQEKYVTTWSFKPIEVAEDDPVLSVEEDGKNYIIWDVVTGKPLRSFATHDIPSGGADENGVPIKKKIPWPAFKWSSDDRYVARMLEGQSVSVYELPKMSLLDKVSIKIDAVRDFEWAPATPQREGVKTYEQLFCFWTPEVGSNPAKVGLMSIPSKEIVRTRNLFNVSDAKLHWQSQAAYVCVKVDRHSKSRKSMATNLEIFRVRERGVPVEVVDSIKDTVINFAWEPKGDRFVLITTAEVVVATAVPPKTSVSFFCPEKVKGAGVGSFKHIRTIDKKNSNAIYWSPKGRFVIVATVRSQQSFELDFWDLDYEGEKPESDKDLTANLQLMSTADHYGVTDVDWDPTGRYVATSASMWKHSVSFLSLYPSYPLYLQLLSQPLTHLRWKTATTSTTSKASSCVKSTLTNSSNSPGVHGRQPSFPKTSKSKSARTYASTAAILTRLTASRMIKRRALWWRRGGGCYKSGSRGGRRSWRICLRRGGSSGWWRIRRRRERRRERAMRRVG